MDSPFVGGPSTFRAANRRGGREPDAALDGIPAPARGKIFHGRAQRRHGQWRQSSVFLFDLGSVIIVSHAVAAKSKHRGLAVQLTELSASEGSGFFPNTE